MIQCQRAKIEDATFYMIILIGGTGFVGKHMCCLLHNAKIPAISFSRNPDHSFLQKHAPSIKSAGIQEIFSKELSKTLKQATALVYLASHSIPGQVGNTIGIELAENISPATQLLSKIADINPQIRFVLVSSGGTVYGGNHQNPIDETCATSPSTPYAFSKVVLEQYLQYLSTTKGNPYTILRAANPVGEWHSNQLQGFVGSTLQSVRTNQPIVVYGEGNVIRDYFDANDLCKAILLSANRSTNLGNSIWNVGSGVGKTLTEVISLVEKVSGITPTVSLADARAVDLPYSVLDCSKIKRELGWHCESSLPDTMQRMWHAHSDQ